MIKVADIIYCTSDYIYNLRKKQHNKVYLVQNGCNKEMINKKNYKKIESFKFLKRPVCIFSGACGWWVSTYLIRNVAKEFYTIVIGQEFGKKIPENVHKQHSLPHEKMIDFIYNTDIGLLPFNTKLEVTQAANPIKLWEYMACGLPVVSTKWNETDKKELEDVVFVANNDKDFVELIEQYSRLSFLDKQDIKQKCFKIAENNTWEKRFEIINNSLQEMGVKV
jgi:glycosyltransferase involved in cell wall biosynthesis